MSCSSIAFRMQECPNRLRLDFVWLHIWSEAATSIACQTQLINQWMRTVPVSEL